MADQKQQLFRYREEAMATHFEILIAHEDQDFAKSLAALCFRELDRLEELLSRFREGSDIDRINHLKQGETILISEACYECLRQAFEIHIITEGLFDIASGGFMNLIRDPEGNPIQASEEEWTQVQQARQTGSLKLHNNRAAITCEAEGLNLDLGGIGKGYVLDCLSALLIEMGANDFLLSAGGSTLLSKGSAVDNKAWTANLLSDGEGLNIELFDECLSSSGYAIQGIHIIKRGVLNDPGEIKRIWVKTTQAALADALSTTFLMMDQVQIKNLSELLEINVEAWKESSEGIEKFN